VWLQQQGLCAWTESPLSLTEARLEHNHQTGEFRGFVTNAANSAEGLLNELTPQKQALFIERALPEAFTRILQRAMVAA
jgi:hypothetical protein